MVPGDARHCAGRLVSPAAFNGLGLVPAACWARCAWPCASLSWAAGWLQLALPWLWTLGGAAWVLGVPGCCVWVWFAGRACRAGLRIVGGGWRCGWPGWPWPRRVAGINFLLSVLAWSGLPPTSLPTLPAAPSGLRFTRANWRQHQPGKSWEGCLGRHGWCAGAGSGLGYGLDAHWRPPCPACTPTWRGAAGGCWLVGALFMAAMSVVGDLVESLIKRSAGVRTAAACCPAMAACSTASMRFCPRCHWPRCFLTTTP